MAKKKFPVADFPIEGLSVPLATLVAAVKKVKDLQEKCSCKPFCESCGRDNIEVDDDGTEYCGDCGPDWGGELCWPHAHASSLDPKADKWERQFMCREHAKQHRQFCRECYAEEDARNALKEGV